LHHLGSQGCSAVGLEPHSRSWSARVWSWDACTPQHRSAHRSQTPYACTSWHSSSTPQSLYPSSPTLVSCYGFAFSIAVQGRIQGSWSSSWWVLSPLTRDS
jgi:hypothetical protein